MAEILTVSNNQPVRIRGKCTKFQFELAYTSTHADAHTQAYDLQRARITNMCVSVCVCERAQINKQNSLSDTHHKSHNV